MHLKGKQIKDYVIGDVLVDFKDMHLLQGTKTNSQQVSILMIDKKNVEHESFLFYNNLLLENKFKVHPQYIEPVQSTNNIYIIL